MEAAVITILNADGPGEGLNDATPVQPVGGNNGQTVGEQRLVVLQRASEIWGGILVSAVPIEVAAKFDPLSCTQTSGTLARAGAVSFYRDFAGAPLLNTYYPIALANALAGLDLTPLVHEIGATFNSDVGTAGCLSSARWYYGLDHQAPSGSFDLLDTVLHEFAHGLGFVSTVDVHIGERLNNFDDIFMRHLEDHRTGKTYGEMSDSERAAAGVAGSSLHWVGTNVIAMSSLLSSGRGFGGHVEMYAPNPVEPGSSVSHFSGSLSPDELMEPFATATTDRRLTVELFKDLGWRTVEERPVIVAGGMEVLLENCVPPNGLIDPGETVTVTLWLRNSGGTSTSNLIAAIEAGAGVLFGSFPQAYGALQPNGTAVGRPFTFTAAGSCGSVVQAILKLADGTNELGEVAFHFTLGGIASLSQPASIITPNSGAASPYPSTITVSGQPAGIRGVTVRLHRLSHPRPDDLDILLVGPGGQSVVLMSDVGGGNTVSSATLTFDDAAAASLPDSGPIASGTFRPTNFGAGDSFPSPAPSGPHGSALSVFEGTNPNGVWALFVFDDSHPRFGSVADGWSLSFPACCQDISNQPPVLSLRSSPLNYLENGGAVIIDSGAAVSHLGSPHFQNGRLTVTLFENGEPDDSIGVRDAA